MRRCFSDDFTFWMRLWICGLGLSIVTVQSIELDCHEAVAEPIVAAARKVLTEIRSDDVEVLGPARRGREDAFGVLRTCRKEGAPAADEVSLVATNRTSAGGAGDSQFDRFLNCLFDLARKLSLGCPGDV
ncbi:hypothetical protein XH93_11385 [Bradyrhizobium sp. CCBAU 51753]|nr:hypothetical protein XH93_11385 [Bradyrhizobium sp. CCBAU 51753]